MGERVCNRLGNPRAWLVASVAVACGLAALGGHGWASAAGEGTFQFSSATYSAPEGTFAHVTVNRIGGTTLTAPVVVTLELSGHTTNEDVPAAAVTQLLTFPANSNLASLTADIQTLNINRFVDKDIQVTIRSVSCACTIGFPGTATITILGTGTPRVTEVTPKAGGFDADVPSTPPFTDTIIHVTLSPAEVLRAIGVPPPPSPTTSAAASVQVRVPMPLAAPPQPVGAPEATGSIQRLETTPPEIAPSTEPAGLDYRKIADHVYQDIRHRLQVELERQRGLS